MPSKQRNYQVQPFGVAGAWQTSDHRFRNRAKALLAELELVASGITRDWPAHLTNGITSRNQHPDLWDRCDHRDWLSDSIRVYAAMAIEGFLNFYGVYRLGPRAFEKRIANLPMLPKLQELLRHCDGLTIHIDDEIAQSLQAVARSRNALVHPRAREFRDTGAIPSAHVPGEARLVVVAMEAFFAHFSRLVPEGSFLTERGSET